jgi:accessory colonization factor AcfC
LNHAGRIENMTLPIHKKALLPLLALTLTGTLHAQSRPQTSPPWSQGANDPASRKGYTFQVPDVDNVPDLHGNPSDAKLVLFIGGNQFFVLPHLIAGFVRLHPELAGRIYYETLPPGILRRQIAANDTLTLGNLTLHVQPDVYEAGARVLHGMADKHQLKDVTEYATNTLEIMIPAGNPKHITSLRDLGRADLRLSMPNPQWEGVANQIATSLRKAGGDALVEQVYQKKVADGTTVLTEIHHRQTPMRILQGHADAGVTWASEVQFQQQIGNPITGVEIPAAENSTAIYAAGMLPDAPHPEAAAQWLAYLKTPEAQAAFHQFGFQPIAASAK